MKTMSCGFWEKNDEDVIVWTDKLRINNEEV